MSKLREIFSQLRAWKNEDTKNRAFVLIAVDEKNAPFCDAFVSLDGHQRQLTDAMKIALPRNGHLLAHITLAAIKELQDGSVPTDINLN